MKLKNITKSKILNKEISFGVGIRQARTVDIGKIMKTCGYDWLFIDLEHNSMDIDMATQISMAAQDTGITPIVRVPDFCLLYTSPSPRDLSTSRMPSSA